MKQIEIENLSKLNFLEIKLVKFLNPKFHLVRIKQISNKEFCKV